MKFLTPALFQVSTNFVLEKVSNCSGGQQLLLQIHPGCTLYSLKIVTFAVNREFTVRMGLGSGDF